jgi:hypothetical protein
VESVEVERAEVERVEVEVDVDDDATLLTRL